jgi:hypothetical protein
MQTALEVTAGSGCSPADDEGAGSTEPELAPPLVPARLRALLALRPERPLLVCALDDGPPLTWAVAGADNQGPPLAWAVADEEGPPLAWAAGSEDDEEPPLAVLLADAADTELGKAGMAEAYMKWSASEW